MSNYIHDSAIIHIDAKIEENVKIGAYSIIGPNVNIGKGSIIHSHVVIDGYTSIGKNNLVYPFSVLGSTPQHTNIKVKNQNLL